jgi:ubiquinone/menaquinone biosynthesis C-methylase UbiE
MEPNLPFEIREQRAFFAKEAELYEQTHSEGDENGRALAWLISCLELYGLESVLEVGAGTGRSLRKIKAALPRVQCVGIEPVGEMREMGHKTGLAPEELGDGDVMQLPFADSSFDVVAEFAVLHHVSDPQRAVSEMLRVARRAIFISDVNNVGHGPTFARLLKVALRTLGLWKAVDWVRNGGRRYHVSVGDGVSYSYSAFDNLSQIRRRCAAVFVLNTGSLESRMGNLIGSSHVAILGLLKEDHRSQ